uniref:Uncharacterized protein n=1 Tax=Lygus hesperus TaxID=30085 RepID=A0A146MCB1_LYGHE
MKQTIWNIDTSSSEGGGSDEDDNPLELTVWSSSDGEEDGVGAEGAVGAGSQDTVSDNDTNCTCEDSERREVRQRVESLVKRFTEEHVPESVLSLLTDIGVTWQSTGLESLQPAVAASNFDLRPPMQQLRCWDSPGGTDCEAADRTILLSHDVESTVGGSKKITEKCLLLESDDEATCVADTFENVLQVV